MSQSPTFDGPTPSLTGEEEGPQGEEEFVQEWEELLAPAAEDWPKEDMSNDHPPEATQTPRRTWTRVIRGRISTKEPTASIQPGDPLHQVIPKEDNEDTLSNEGTQWSSETDKWKSFFIVVGNIEKQKLPDPTLIRNEHTEDNKVQIELITSEKGKGSCDTHKYTTATEGEAGEEVLSPASNKGMDPWNDVTLIRYLQHHDFADDSTPAERKRCRSRANKYSFINGCLTTKKRPHQKIPRPQERLGIIRTCHDTKGHAGLNTTLGLIHHQYHWKGIKKDVQTYISTCQICQTSNPQFFAAPELVQLTPPRAFGRWGIDLLCSKPLTASGSRYIICAIDYLTKWVELGALFGRTSQHVAAWTEDNVLRRFPYPDEVITDQGVEFSGDFHHMLMAYSITHRRARVRHPQSNGLVE